VGNKIYARYYDDQNYKRTYFGDFNPDLFLLSKHDMGYRSVHNETLQPFNFKSITDAKKFVKDHNDISNVSVFGNQNYYIQYISENYRGNIDWEFDKIICANVDIEVKKVSDDGRVGYSDPYDAYNEITSIQIEQANKFYILSTKPYTEKSSDVTYLQCDDEKDLLNEFLNHWQELRPDIITGWNIEQFDVPYLVNRITRVLGEKASYRLSPAYSHIKKKEFCVDLNAYKDVREYKIAGLSVLDYMKIYKKFTFKERDSYALNNIAYVELGEKKVDYSEVQNLDELFDQDFEKFIDYGIKDVYLVKRLDNKLQLLRLVYTLAYKAKIPHQDVFSQVRMWDSLVYNKLKENDVVIPAKEHYSKSEKFRGAKVFDPKVGLHEWVISFDLDGLYPHLIMMYNISPEKMLTDNETPKEMEYCSIDDMIEGQFKQTDILEDNNVTMTANQEFYRKDSQGFIPQMMQDLYNQRKVIKKEQLASEQVVVDIKNILKERVNA